jgi:hypothetical protein
MFIANSSGNPQDKQIFSQFAAAWLRLANVIETDRALIEHWGDLHIVSD